MAFADDLEDIRKRLAQLNYVDIDTQIASGDELSLSRTLDSIIVLSGQLRAHVEGRNGKQRETLIRKLRKALGYTYP